VLIHDGLLIQSTLIVALVLLPQLDALIVLVATMRQVAALVQ
jgi:hypothetical protein